MECTPLKLYYCSIYDKSYSLRQFLWNHATKFYNNNNINVANVIRLLFTIKVGGNTQKKCADYIDNKLANNMIPFNLFFNFEFREIMIIISLNISH